MGEYMGSEAEAITKLKTDPKGNLFAYYEKANKFALLNFDQNKNQIQIEKTFEIPGAPAEGEKCTSVEFYENKLYRTCIENRSSVMVKVYEVDSENLILKEL